MALTPSTTALTEDFRDAAKKNLDMLGNRRNSIEQSIKLTEEKHRKALADELKPLEESLRDCNAAIYATERHIQALPPAPPARFVPQVKETQQTAEDTRQTA